MEPVKLELTMDQIELIVNVLDVIDLDDIWEDGTDESFLDLEHDKMVKLQRYLLNKLG